MGAQVDEMLIYDTREAPVRCHRISRRQLSETIRLAAYRFWVSERRMPVAMVMSRQLAQVFTDQLEQPLIGALGFFGFFDLDDAAQVPILGRDAYLDPLFTFL